MANPSLMTARITLQRLSQSVVAGVVSNAWTDIATVSSKLEWQSSVETVSSDQQTVSRTVVGEIRFSPNLRELTERDRILWEGKIFAVNAWLPVPAVRPDVITFTASYCP